MSYLKTSPELITDPASILLIAEISHTLRAQGRPSATGLIPDSGVDSPLVLGQHREIPQSQIGMTTYSAFENAASNFNTPVSGRSPWNLIGAVSLDAIFCPYNNLADSGRVGEFMPYWTSPDDINSVGNSITLNPFNPFNQLQNLSPYGNYYNNDPWISGGHNIAFACNYNPEDTGYVGESGTYPGGTGSPVDFYFEKDHWARHTVETSGIRAVGLKGPLVLTGWGYDVDDNPVPADTGDPTLFHAESSWNLHRWKSGPVDLRWDNERGVWTGGNTTKLYLVKLTNLYTPPSFSFEVDRSNTRDQYTRNAPATLRDYDSTGNLYDPEYVAYTNNSAANVGYYEQLDYDGIEFPYYEAFIIRETKESPVANANNFYNIWTQDCNDCGHITNSCGGGHDTSSVKKKVLIENPLRQSFDVGDLAFTVYTGRKQRVNTGNFTGGTGAGASGTITTNASGDATFNVTSAGIGYTLGGFGIVGSGCNICSNLSLVFTDGELVSGILEPSGGFTPSQTCSVTVYPNDAQAETESLPVHWVIQSEFKSQQVVTHVECDNGILQSCTMKIQTQGFKTCEWCGEDTAYINS